MTGGKLVGIAQYAVASAPDQLCCLGLGSCVAVFLYDPVGKIGGVLHALLPKAPRNRETDAKYADSGIKMLQDALISRGAHRRRLVAKLVGGAKMFENMDLGISDIGGENVRASRATLRALGIRVIAEDVLGNKGRSAYYSLETGTITIRTAFSPDKRI